MAETQYIEVAVLLPVYGTYTYKIPDNMKERVSPGMRVLVPFGRRRVTGYVLGSSTGDTGFRVKLILDILDDIPLFPASMIPFFKWIADYYLHPLGDVIKTALPVGLNQYDVVMFSLTDQGRKKVKTGSLPPAQREILSLLDDQGPVPLKKIQKHTRNPAANRVLKKMEGAGFVRRRVELKKDSTKLKKETFVVFIRVPESEARLSKKRRDILTLVQKEGEISLRKLKERVPTAPRLVKPLEAAGYIRRIDKTVFQDPLGDPVDPDMPPRLTGEQEQVVQGIQKEMTRGFCSCLLSGVTGSGKTEVYMRIAREALKKNKTVIVLVPEISLISQTERRFRARFGNRIAVLHSGLSKAELLDQWRRIMKREVSLVIGARSAIFAPFDNPGIIIVDEEHDTSYKQESGLRYNARDLAVVRAKLNDIPAVLGSATPSVQSYYNACSGKFRELKLTERINRKPLPEITLVDLKQYRDARGVKKIITPVLSKAVRECLDRGEQALIFLNRRGFATFPLCGKCGQGIRCRFCELTMTFHKGENCYRCHLCGYSVSSKMKCPACKADKIIHLGFGTERVETILTDLFPDARIARMDQDTTRKKGQLVRLLKMLKNRTVDIVVGTQMLAKGHDFPFITLVGVVCADLSLNFPDFRAGERTFQLLAQVAGRAGRGERKGKVIMQTYNPDHFTIAASKNQDFVDFYHNEVPFRKALLYPPFSRIIQLKISGTLEEKVKAHSLMIGDMLKSMVKNEDALQRTTEVLGPVRAGIPRISTRFRWQILLKGKNAALLNRMVKQMAADKNIRNHHNIHVSFDVDPYFMM